jgi:cytochrome c-type biogenesis protein CcmH/NrfF
MSALNAVLLASAVVPVTIVVVGSWFFLRAGRRHDEREEARTDAEAAARNGHKGHV